MYEYHQIQKKMKFIHIKDNPDDISHISQTEIELKRQILKSGNSSKFICLQISDMKQE